MFGHWKFQTGADTMCFWLTIGLASDDVAKLSNAWQRGKLVLNKGSAHTKACWEKVSHLAKLFISSQRGSNGFDNFFTGYISASHFKGYWGSDKCGAVFRSIDDFSACFVWDAIVVYNQLCRLLRRLRGCDVALASPISSGKLHDYVIICAIFQNSLNNIEQ